MNNKEKQIEEMEDIISCCWNTISAAKKLYNAGYRKIPEDAVVLTGRELADRTGEIWKQAQKQARKETAEKILQAVDIESNGQTISITNYLRKKFGVEGKK